MTDRRATALVMCLLFAFYVLFSSLRIDSGDGETMYQVTRSVIEGRGFAIPVPSAIVGAVDSLGRTTHDEQGRSRPYGAWGIDGRFYAQYGIGQSLLAVPFYLLGRWFHRWTGWGTEGFVTRAAVMLSNPCVLALTGGFLYLLARELGYGPRAAVALALTVGLATPLWINSKTFASEPLVTLALVVAVLAARWGDRGTKRGWLICGIALGVVVTVRLAALVVTPIFLVYAMLCKRHRWQALALVLAPLSIAGCGVAAYNLIRFGSPFYTGYHLYSEAWGAPWIGLFGLVFSPGRGLLWHCPPVVLGLAGSIPFMRRQPRVAALLGGVSVPYWLVHASWSHWHGGGCWGPRMILPTIPFLILPAAELFQRPPRRAYMQAAMAIILVAGWIVQVPVILVHPARTFQTLYDQSASPAEYVRRLLYRPRDSLLLTQWRGLLEVAGLMRHPESRAAVLTMVRMVEKEPDLAMDRQTRMANLLSLNAFDLWPVTWAVLGAPVAFLVAAEVVLAALMGWAAWRLKRVT